MSIVLRLIVLLTCYCCSLKVPGHTIPMLPMEDTIDATLLICLIALLLLCSDVLPFYLMIIYCDTRPWALLTWSAMLRWLLMMLLMTDVERAGGRADVLFLWPVDAGWLYTAEADLTWRLMGPADDPMGWRRTAGGCGIDWWWKTAKWYLWLWKVTVVVTVPVFERRWWMIQYIQCWRSGGGKADVTVTVVRMEGQWESTIATVLMTSIPLLSHSPLQYSIIDMALLCCEEPGDDMMYYYSEDILQLLFYVCYYYLFVLFCMNTIEFFRKYVYSNCAIDTMMNEVLLLLMMFFYSWYLLFIRDEIAFYYLHFIVGLLTFQVLTCCHCLVILVTAVYCVLIILTDIVYSIYSYQYYEIAFLFCWHIWYDDVTAIWPVSDDWQWAIVIVFPLTWRFLNTIWYLYSGIVICSVWFGILRWFILTFRSFTVVRVLPGFCCSGVYWFMVITYRCSCDSWMPVLCVTYAESTFWFRPFRLPERPRSPRLPLPFFSCDLPDVVVRYVRCCSHQCLLVVRWCCCVWAAVPPPPPYLHIPRSSLPVVAVRFVLLNGDGCYVYRSSLVGSGICSYVYCIRYWTTIFLLVFSVLVMMPFVILWPSAVLPLFSGEPVISTYDVHLLLPLWPIPLLLALQTRPDYLHILIHCDVVIIGIPDLVEMPVLFVWWPSRWCLGLLLFLRFTVFSCRLIHWWYDWLPLITVITCCLLPVKLVFDRWCLFIYSPTGGIIPHSLLTLMEFYSIVLMTVPAVPPSYLSITVGGDRRCCWWWLLYYLMIDTVDTLPELLVTDITLLFWWLPIFLIVVHSLVGWATLRCMLFFLDDLLTIRLWLFIVTVILIFCCSYMTIVVIYFVFIDCWPLFKLLEVMMLSAVPHCCAVVITIVAGPYRIYHWLYSDLTVGIVPSELTLHLFWLTFLRLFPTYRQYWPGWPVDCSSAGRELPYLWLQYYCARRYSLMRRPDHSNLFRGWYIDDLLSRWPLTLTLLPADIPVADPLLADITVTDAIADYGDLATCSIIILPIHHHAGIRDFYSIVDLFPITVNLSPFPWPVKFILPICWAWLRCSCGVCCLLFRYRCRWIPRLRIPLRMRVPLLVVTLFRVNLHYVV